MCQMFKFNGAFEMSIGKNPGGGVVEKERQKDFLTHEIIK